MRHDDLEVMHGLEAWVAGQPDKSFRIDLVPVAVCERLKARMRSLNGISFNSELVRAGYPNHVVINQSTVVMPDELANDGESELEHQIEDELFSKYVAAQCMVVG